MTPNDRISPAPEEEIDLVALLRSLWSYKSLIAAVTFVCTLAAVIYAVSATRFYRAEVVVTEVTDRSLGGAGGLASQLGGLANIAGVNLAQNSAGREARAVLQSSHLASEFVKRNDLVSTLLTGKEKSPTVWQAVQRFKSTVLDIREDVRKGVTTVAIEWTDPAVTARWANEFVALANELVRTRALEESKRNINYLNEQIAATSVVELQRVMYGLIESETKTLMLANGRVEYAFTVVDPAVPPEIAERPRRMVIALMGVFAGLLIGLVAALVHNSWRARHNDIPR